MCVQTAAAGLSRDPSGHRGTGRVTIVSVKILRAPRSGTGPLIPRLMRNYRLPSGIFHRRSDSAPAKVERKVVGRELRYDNRDVRQDNNVVTLILIGRR